MVKIFKKDIMILSLIIGVFLGVLANVPYIGIFGLFSMLFLSAPIVILYLVMAGKMDLVGVKDSIIDGGLCGFVSNITFSIAYCLTNVMLFLFFHYTSNSILSSMITQAPVWLIVVCVLFIGVLTATTNAFSAMGVYYIINLIREVYAKSHKEEGIWQNLNQK